MFSHNGRISEKQMNCMLVLPLFSGGIFILPHLAARIFDRSIVPGLTTFLLMTLAYIAIFILYGSRSEIHGVNAADHIASSKWILMIQILRCFVRLLLYILLSVAVLQEGQVPFVDKSMGNSVQNMMLLLPLLLVSYYGANHDIEKQGRIFEMILWTAFVPYIVMILFGLKDVSGEVFAINNELSVGKLLLYAFSLLTFITPVENYLWLRRYTGKSEHMDLKTYTLIAASVLVICVITVVMLGIYGINGAAGEDMVSIAIMRYIELPLGVLQRFDVLMVWFFMTGCFGLVSSLLFYMRELIAYMSSKKAAARILLVMLIAAVITALTLPAYGTAIGIFVVYGALVDVPLSLILPLCIMVKRKKKMCIFAMLLSAAIPILTGCAHNIENIEQRDYATFIIVTSPEEAVYMSEIDGDSHGKRYHFTLGIAKEKRNGQESRAENIVEITADDFAELSGSYGSIRGKDLSLSHLKVIIASGDVSGNNFQSLLYDIDKTDEVAKTCPLLFCMNKNEIENYISEAEEPIGTYIDNLVQTAGKNGRHIPKLMDYLKAEREGEKVIIYMLNVNGDYLNLICMGE